MKKATKKAPRAQASSVEEPVVVESAQETVVVAATPADESDDNEAVYEETPANAPVVSAIPVVTPPPVAPTNLNILLSHALLSKLKRSAEDEGISLEALATELLSEGVVLRAWEIIQRNSAMRGNAQSGPPQGNQGFRGGNHAGGNQPRHHGGGGNYGGPNNNQNRPPRNNNAWMEDKAAFLEYVRNQEKRRR